MKSVLLIHSGTIQHYRCSIYEYLTTYLMRFGYLISFIAGGIESNSCKYNFTYIEKKLSLYSIAKTICLNKPDVVIIFSGFKSLWLFPLIILNKFLRIKTIYWGHGINLQKKNSYRSIHNLYHWLSDGIILYAEHLREYVNTKHSKKIFIANNTLNLSSLPEIKMTKEEILAKYNINTVKNIISVGRMQKRKRIDDLIKAFEKIDKDDIGLLLVGPDPDGLLERIDHPRIYVLGPLYRENVAELLYACDICCIPGAIGLSIVDAFYYGLPMITEDVEHGPEIMYLKDGVNGFMVEKGDCNALADKIASLLDDNELYDKMSITARHEVETNASIDQMCKGFVDAIEFTLAR